MTTMHAASATLVPVPSDLVTPLADVAPASSATLKRVVYVVSAFPCWSETFIVREIHALIDAGVDVRIVSLKRAPSGPVQTDAAALLDRLHAPQAGLVAARAVMRAVLAHPVQVAAAAGRIMRGTWRQPMAMAKSLAALARGLEHLPWLEEFGPELIHAHWATYPSTVAWALGRILRRPFGFTSHAHDIFVSRQLLSDKLADSALAVTISRHNVDWFDRHVSDAAHRKLQVVHCGVDLGHAEWKPTGRSNDLIVATGRLHPIKGFDTLIDALAILQGRKVHFRCRIIGEGPLRADLEERIRRHGLATRIELAGAKPQESVRASLDEAAVFALPSQIAEDGGRDGIPVALMEAMASGCPVVSCKTSGIPELVCNGDTGLLVDERDAVALADALQRLLGDPGLRLRLSRSAREHVEQQFDARKEARKLHRLMMKAVADVA